MKRGRKGPVLIAILSLIIGLGLWWFDQSAKIATEKMTDATLLAKTIAAARTTPQPQVELPKAPAVQTTAGSDAVAAMPATSDPQANLTTAIQDIAQMTRSRDYGGLYKKYTPPDKFDPGRLALIESTHQQVLNLLAANDPKTRQSVEMATQKALDDSANSLEAMEIQTPTYNAAGDEATYIYLNPEMHDNSITSIPITFIKIDGKWYKKPAVPSNTSPPQDIHNWTHSASP